MSGVSVVVATCDRPRELDACLRSLVSQTFPADRIVVVDDAPGAGQSEAVVERYAHWAPVVYVCGARGGLSDAHNRGVAKVDSPVVAFTDDDVIADEEWLQRLMDRFQDDREVACVTGQIVPFELESRAQHLLEAFAGYGKGAERQVYDLGPNRPSDPLFPFAAGKLGSGANMAFTRAFLDELGGFDPALGAGTRAMGGDDLSAFFEVIQRGYRLVYEPAAVVRHRHGREYGSLRRQVYGCGVGLTAYLAKCVLDRPSLLPRMLVRLPAALLHVGGGRSPKRSRLPYDFPRELVRLERVGMMTGPLAYLASRRHAERAA